MFDVDTFRSVIVKGLKEYLKIPIIRSNQTGEPPKYPYLSYTIRTPQSQNKGTWGEYEDGIDRKPVTQIWSITVQSSSYAEALSLSVKANTWFDYIGRTYLEDNSIIVQSVSEVTPRDNMITIEYEYRNGFDVTFWLMQEVDNTEITNYVGTIESVELGDGLITPLLSEDELNAKLEKRLEGDL